jgi:hypothetical protein
MASQYMEKSERRRTRGVNANADDTILKDLCTKHANSTGNRATMAFGVYKPKVGAEVIVYALQQGSPLDPEFLPGDGAYGALISSQVEVAPSPGLHAEMMIIRELMIKGILDHQNVASSAKNINLRIVCPARKCCADCAGWLRSHDIPHYPDEAGKSTSNWVHPRTGACFRFARGDVSYYQKIRQDGSSILHGSPIDAGGNLRPLRPIR